jgi:protein required for attachment to host cells
MAGRAGDTPLTARAPGVNVPASQSIDRSREESMPNRVTWVLVADGARARLFRADRKARRLQLLWEEESPAARSKTSDLVSDQPGRAMDASGVGQRSAMEAPTDPKRLEKTRFAQHLRDVLAAAEGAGQFHSLVLVAAPQTLGDLRDSLPPAVSGRIEHELAKDLTWVPPHELERHLAPVLWPLA